MEIFKIEELETKDFTPEELTEKVIELYKSAEKTKVSWYISGDPKSVEIDFIDGSGNEMESFKVDRSLYKSIIKPAILSINN